MDVYDIQALMVQEKQKPKQTVKCLVVGPAKYHTSQRHKLWMEKSHVVWDRNSFVAQSRCFLALGFPWKLDLHHYFLHSRYADLVWPREADEKPSAESVTAVLCSLSDLCHHSELVMGTETVDNFFHMLCQMLNITNSFSRDKTNEKRLVSYACKTKNQPKIQ